jgi:hypothetical protein
MCHCVCERVYVEYIFFTVDATFIYGWVSLVSLVIGLQAVVRLPSWQDFSLVLGPM